MKINAEIIKKLIEESDIGKKIDMENIENDKPLSDQGIDSLDLMTILLIIEEKLDINIPDDAIKDLKSIDDIVNYINNK